MCQNISKINGKNKKLGFKTIINGKFINKLKIKAYKAIIRVTFVLEGNRSPSNETVSVYRKTGLKSI